MPPDLRAALRSERGQVLPLMIAMMVLILVGGMVVLWIGVSTSMGANAQTAADAAALAAEQNVVTQLSSPQTGPGGQEAFVSVPNRGAACEVAQRYAERNGAHVIACDPVQATQSMIGWDVQVTVQTNGTLPKGSPDSGQGADARARASTDPFSEASPAVHTAVSYSCDASVVSGPPFKSHGGQNGFFPDPKTDYSYGCEPKLAGALDKLAQARKLSLHGAEGYQGETQADATDPAAVAHGCGDASTTPGIESVPDKVLSQYGLVRPFPQHRDVVELAGVSCNQQTASVDAAGSGPIGFGNVNVHLVPYVNGGPVGSLFPDLGGGGISIGESALQVGCQIYTIWQSLHVSQTFLLIGLMVAQDESDMGQNIGPNRTDPNQSVGVFQQISADGWGTIPEELNVLTAAEMFYKGGHNGTSSTTGLLTYAATHPGEATWQLAQGTQGSGAGQDSDGAANYGAPANMQAAQEMLGEVTSGKCSKAG